MFETGMDFFSASWRKNLHDKGVCNKFCEYCDQEAPNYKLPSNCSVEDVKEADTEAIYNSYIRGFTYSDEVVLQMAYELTLRGH